MRVSFRHVNRYREIAETLAAHGLGFLLDQLGIAGALSLPARLLRRQEPQARLSVPARLRLVLERLGPTFVKLGQYLSTRPDLLPPDYLDELAKLQDQVPPVLPAHIRVVIGLEQGQPVEDLFASFTDEPVASASLGQVHTAVLKTGERVVVKVQRPGVAGRVRMDLDLLAHLAAVLKARSPWATLYDFPAAAEEFAEVLREELDYALEAQNLGHFQHAFAGDTAVRFPRVYPAFTTHRMLVLEYIEGTKITDRQALEAQGVDLPQLARTLVQALLRQVFLDGFFHGDPHPGNLMVDPEGRLVFLDLGMVGQLDDRTRRHLVHLVIGIADRRAAEVASAMEALGVVAPATDRVRLEREIARLIGRYYHLPLEQFDLAEAIRLAMRLAFRHHLRLPADLSLMAKALSTGEGLARQLDPALSLVAVAEPFKRKVLQDRLSVREVREGWRRLQTYGATLAHLPVQAGHVLKKLEAGEITVRHVHEGLPELADRLSATIDRLAIAILVMSVVVGAALIERSGQATGLHLTLTRLGFAAALGLGLWLIIAIFRSGRLS